ncbi:kinase-like protein [Dichotomocladium elegans]|nr:kinase-like protein [Dichotomocladium elegans]
MGATCCKEEPIDFNEEVDLSHFSLLRSVGKGAFGKVRVVQHKAHKQMFALKYINKAKCIQMRAVENIISERRLLEQINYGFIVNLRYAFQDDENLFMVLDLMLGGDLRFHLERMGPLPESQVRFYAAEIALALHYLHEKNIVHRDVKPDNILLNEHGHAHLTDFNIAVSYSHEKPLLSVAGSMAYMAPEILRKRGYTTSVDWWSLGVVCYELLTGNRPFRGKTNELLQASILNDPIEFPEDSHTTGALSTHCRDCVLGLLKRNVDERLGASPQGFARFKKHPWFEGLDWNALENKAIEPPFKPDDKRANFDPTHELEEILLEDNPLKVKKRVPKRSVSNNNLSGTSDGEGCSIASDPEYRIMDKRFLVFDYTKPQHRPKEQVSKPAANKMQIEPGVVKIEVI